jgi:sulfatase modifying factor 1
MLALAAFGIMLGLAYRQRSDPARCPPGSSQLGPRCCGEGQQLERLRCVGTPSRCPSGMKLLSGPRPGCVPETERVSLRGGTLLLAPSDWEAQGVIEARQVRVRPFALDSTEVTYARWERCARAGLCRALSWQEPGLPVTGVNPSEAAALCRFEGGRLPSGDEWLFAAAGVEQRRFPWGQTGLVCRRAVFGTVRGPCAHGARGPEIAGLRPDGATPEGLVDLAGNVAEWTVEPGGTQAVRGGSYLARLAAELKSWAAQPDRGPAADIGFRCAYGAR